MPKEEWFQLLYALEWDYQLFLIGLYQSTLLFLGSDLKATMEGYDVLHRVDLLNFIDGSWFVQVLFVNGF